MNIEPIKNKIISNYKKIKYNVTETYMLKKSRILHEEEYGLHDMEPLITVYTPTYNRAELLIERAVKSVLQQTYTNFEFIIIGDHCTDETEKLISNVKDKRIKFYNIPERGYRYPETPENNWFAGPVIAANTALSLAKGKWIARIDDDDSWSENHLENLLKFAQKGGYEFVSTQYLERKLGVDRIDKGVGAKDPYYTRSDLPITGDNPLIGGTSTWLYRSYLKFMKYNPDCWRKEWNKVNDIDLSLRLFHAGTRMGFLNEVHAYVLPRSGEDTVGLDAYIVAEEKNYSVHS
jgi:glycosyltransferase involved in cell wall biosynthesis